MNWVFLTKKNWTSSYITSYAAFIKCLNIFEYLNGAKMTF